MTYEEFLSKNYPNLLNKIKKEKKRKKLDPYEESSIKNQELRRKFNLKR